MTEAEAAYIAGLFDGEGTITYKKYKEKKAKGTYDCWRISMEIAMTDLYVPSLGNVRIFRNAHDSTFEI